MMDRFAYTAMTGAKHAMGQLANTTNNLANAQTPGFREMLSMYRAAPIKGVNADSRVFVVDTTPGSNFDQGQINVTGNPLDLAIKETGFFAVRRPDGHEVYTRAGNFLIDRNRNLVTANGYRVQGVDGDIEFPADAVDVRIDQLGVITATLEGQPESVPIGQLKMVDIEPFELERAQDGFFEWLGGELSHADWVRADQGSLELSNVNVAKAMVDIINQTRMFDLNMRLIQTAEQNSRQANTLISLQRN